MLRWDDPNARWDSGLRWPSALPPAPTPTPKPRRNHPKTMPADYIPQSYKNLRDWLALQQTDLTASLAANLNMTTAERDGFLAAVGAVLPRVTDIVALMDELDQKTADFTPIHEQQVAILRAAIKRAKTSPGCTPGVIEQMQWAGGGAEFDPDTARPTITLEAQRGRIKIDGRKPGFEAANLYGRKKGEAAWRLIAVRKRKFPYYDEAPLAVPGAPEVREYMAIGVIADDETGQPSEIKEVGYAG